VEWPPLASLTADYFAVIATADVFKGCIKKKDVYFMPPVCFHYSATHHIIFQTGNDH